MVVVGKEDPLYNRCRRLLGKGFVIRLFLGKSHARNKRKKLVLHGKCIQDSTVEVSFGRTKVKRNKLYEATKINNIFTLGLLTVTQLVYMNVPMEFTLFASEF